MLDTLDTSTVLKVALERGGDFADIYSEHVSATSIVCEDGKIEHIIAGIDAGAGVRTVFNHKTAYAYTNRLTQDGLMEVAEAAKCAIRGDCSQRDISLVKKVPEVVHHIKRPPHEVSLDQKVDLVRRAERAARSTDERIRQVKVIYRDSVKRVSIVNADGDLAHDHRTGTLFLVQAVAIQDGVIQTGYEPRGGFMGFELFDEFPPEEVAVLAARRAVMMLQARKAPGGRMPVVLSSDAGGTMIHEAIGHGLEADLAQAGMSVYAGRLGERVASQLISVVDDATLKTRRGSYGYDDEGSSSQRTILVEDGMLRGYLYDRLTALKDKTVSTGNGRRESYRNRPLPRMSNTFILPGAMDPEDILRSTHRGLFVKKMGGGQVNTVNGDFVFEVTEGYLIENGRVCEPVRGATLIGNGPRVLTEIDMVGSDLGFGIGTCGKEGQGVPVADAQPTLRIPEIVVGGVV